MRLLLPVVFLALLAVPAAAAAPEVAIVDHDVPAELAPVLGKVKAGTDVPVLLPDVLPYEDVELFPEGSGRRKAWRMNLGSIKGCHNATVCFVASFSARRGAKPSGATKVTLRGERTGWFTPLRCGASCSPPTIAWRQHRSAYAIQARVGIKKSERRILVRMANQAIRAGRR